MSPVNQPGATAPQDDDLKVLHNMGYAQQLSRRMGVFLQLCHFLFDHLHPLGWHQLAGTGHLGGAGGAAIGIGWPLGCLISGVFAMAMAQISSAYPTAGGLYHWGSILGNRFTGWLTAWFNLLGLITVLGAINVGTYYFFLVPSDRPWEWKTPSPHGSLSWRS